MSAIEATLAPYAETIGRSPSSTIIPPRVDPDTAGRKAVEALGGTTGRRTLSSGLQLQGTLGTGGMGVVHLAVQASVGRHVAVKSLRDDHTTDAAVLSLLQEAWITGTLEHPNVLPVYDIAVDAKARPLIVLKRIEGDAWSKFLVDPRGVEQRFDEDPLVWHLQVLMQVCNAVRFAHSRGILHRDLKPENVMIGEFGEVYLLDWGIAVSLRDDPEGRLPRAADAHALAGTPAYMAPEMMAGDGGALSERTDVYLLGAILYEILVGHPPHRFRSLGELVESATRIPQLPSSVPDEIAQVCRRAMDPQPQERYPDAEALRIAIGSFLRHRGATRLLQTAEDALTRLRKALQAPVDDLVAHRLCVYNLLTECRFGFREALASWPDNAVAKAGQRAALLEMIEYELAVPDPAAAAALFAELDDPPADLRARIDDATAHAAAERRELATLREGARQLDRTIGQRTRVFAAGLLGLGWIVFPLAGHFNRAAMEESPMRTWWPAVFIVLILGLATWGRDSLSKTAFNRRFVAGTLWIMVAEFIVAIVGYGILGLSGPVVGVIHTTTALAALGMLAILFEPYLWIATIGNTLALFAMAWWPQWQLVFVSLGNATIVGTMVLAWRPASRRRVQG